jgi:predicted membrane protein
MSWNRIIFGGLLIAIGLGLVAERIGLISDFGDQLATWWPLILVLVGVLQVATRAGSVLTGAILVLLGAVLLGQRLGVLPDDFLSTYWPLGLILIGVWVLVGGRRVPRLFRQVERDQVDAFAMLGGVSQVVHSESFRGGQATAILGGAELDLRQARLHPEGAQIGVTALLGGVEIMVPVGWRVVPRGVQLLGGFENTTSRPMATANGEVQPGASAATPGPDLQIRYLALLGGVEVHN